MLDQDEPNKRHCSNVNLLMKIILYWIKKGVDINHRRATVEGRLSAEYLPKKASRSFGNKHRQQSSKSIQAEKGPCIREVAKIHHYPSEKQGNGAS